MSQLIKSDILFKVDLPDKIELLKEISRSSWESHYINSIFWPFECWLMRKRLCTKTQRMRMFKAKEDSKQLLLDLGVTNNNDQIFEFIVDKDNQGMTWGGYARDRDGCVQQAVKV